MFLKTVTSAFFARRHRKNEPPKHEVLKERNKIIHVFLFRPFRAPILFCIITGDCATKSVACHRLQKHLISLGYFNYSTKPNSRLVGLKKYFMN